MTTCTDCNNARGSLQELFAHFKQSGGLPCLSKRMHTIASTDSVCKSSSASVDDGGADAASSSPDGCASADPSSEWEPQLQLCSIADTILCRTIKKYGDLDGLASVAFGHQISKAEADDYLCAYLAESRIIGRLEVKWCESLSVAGKVVSRRQSCKPEARKFTLYVFDAEAAGAETASTVLRQYGIRCFAAHEIGTHLVRSLNEGHQPWTLRRAEIGLTAPNSRVGLQTEEGLATLNTVLHAKSKLLFSAALLYCA